MNPLPYLSKSQSLSILVVDDEELVLGVIYHYLTDFYKFQVNCVQSGCEALVLLEKGRYDAIIADYEMESMSGITLLKTLRARGDDTPFIIFTGKGREQVVIESYENGADGYVQKGDDIKAQFVELSHKIISIVEKRNTERKLCEREKHYRILTENISDVVWILDPDTGFFKYVSPSVEKLLGYTAEEILARPVKDAVTPEAARYVHDVTISRKDTFLSGINTPVFYRDEIEQLCKDGSTVWTEVITNYYLNEETGKVEIRGVTRDISARKRIECYLYQLNKLKESLLGSKDLEEKLRIVTDGLVRIFDADLAGIWIIKDGDICDSGCIYAANFKGSSVCIKKTPCLHLSASSSRHTHIDGDQRRIPIGFSIIGKIVNSDVTRFISNSILSDPEMMDNFQAQTFDITSFAGFRLLSSEGSPIGVLALFRKTQISPDDVEFMEDVANATTQILITGAAERARIESENFLNTIIENIPDAIFVKDIPGYRYIRFNKAGEDLVGYPREELIGRTNSELLPKAEADFFTASDKKTILSGSVTDIPQELLHTRFKGDRILHTRKLPIFDESGNPRYLFGISEDITDQVKIREDLDRMRVQLEYLLGVTGTRIDIIDEGYNLIYVDPTWQKKYGDYHGIKCYDYFMDRKNTCPSCVVPEVLRTKRKIITEEILVKEENRVVEVHTIPFQENDGRWCVAEFNIDITERKRGEERIYQYIRSLELISRRSIEMLDLEDDSELFSFIGEVIKELTPSGIIVIISQVDALGKSVTPRSIIGLESKHKELLGCNAASLFDISCPLSVEALDYLISGKIGEIPYELSTLTTGVFPDELYQNIESSHLIGKMYWAGLSWKQNLQGSVVMILPPDNDLYNQSLIEIFIQIAAIELQRRKIAAALREERGLFVGGPVVIFRWPARKGGPVLYVSSNVTSQFGYLPEEFLDGTILFDDIIHPDDRNLIRKEFEKLNISGILTFEQEFRIRRRDGKYRWIYDFTVIERGSSGNIDFFLGYIQDIDDRKSVERLLLESEENARSLINAPKESIFMIDSDGNTLYANETGASRLGVTIDQIVGRSIFDFISPDLALNRRQYFEKAILTGEPVRFHDEWLGRILENNFYPLKSENGTITRIAIYARDVTEKLESERRIIESETKYRELVENANSIIIRFDKDGKVEFFNEFGREFFGFSEEEIIRKGLFGTILEERDSSGFDLLQTMVDLFQNPEKYHHNENENVCKDGRKVWVAWRNKPIYEQGVFVGLLSVGTDMTQRKKAEEALLSREQFLSNIFSSIQDGISILDSDMRIIRVNDTMERWYSHAGQIIGRKCFEVYHGLDHRCEKCPSYITLTTGKAAREIVPKRGPDLNIEGWLELYSFPLLELKNGNMTGLIEYVRDITEKRFTEEALSEANKKLNLLSSITRHDILNLITALRGYQEICEQIVLDEKVRNYLTKQVLLTKLIQAQIEFTKDYQDLGVYSPAWHNVIACIRKAGNKISFESVQMTINISPVEILADPLFEKVFYTLIENAIRHGERITQIHWSGHETEKEFIIICEDDGIGVLDVEKERIFKRGVGKNTGLGLFLIREVLAITGLSIRETGDYGKGARFEIFVPKGAYKSISNPISDAYAEK